METLFSIPTNAFKFGVKHTIKAKKKMHITMIILTMPAPPASPFISLIAIGPHLSKAFKIKPKGFPINLINKHNDIAKDIMIIDTATAKLIGSFRKYSKINIYLVSLFQSKNIIYDISKKPADTVSPNNAQKVSTIVTPRVNFERMLKEKKMLK